MIVNEEDTILYLNRRDVEFVCAAIDSIGIIRELFSLHGSGQALLAEEAYLAWANDRGEPVRSLNMPGYVGGSFQSAGTKIINGNIVNPSRGLPRASGLTMLYDRTSVRINCIMEGAYLSSLRTASVTVLCAEMLKGKVIEQVAVIGAGVLAEAHIKLLAMRLPQLHTIRIFDIERARITRLRALTSAVLQEHGVELRETISAEEAITAAQLIIPMTTTTTGYIQWNWLQSGAILVNVSLDDPLPEVVLRADRVIVDDWQLVKNDTRRLLGRMYRMGQIIGPDEPADEIQQEPHRRRIDAQFGEVVTGRKKGRARLDDIVLVNPFGMAIEDVALATHVYRKALELKRGVWLER
jgi:N-[(2S)-2-amino-2-carboxyethyl]-L-glutamate dehydrogenase